MKKILGISAFYHDSAAALIIGNMVIAAAQEERFTRIKHTSEFPKNAIKYCLKEGGLKIDELDAIVFYDKPLLKFERLLETYYTFTPKGLFSFLKAMPIWLKEKLFCRRLIYEGLKEVGPYRKSEFKLLFSGHHLSHAASAFFTSPYENSAILTIDGVGEWNTATICFGESNKIKILKELNFPHSVGLLYTSFTYFLGFKINSGEYKLMGLSPYGDPDSRETHYFLRLIKENLINIKDDGSVWLNQDFFKYSTSLRMINDKKWEKIFGFRPRRSNEKIEQKHCNLALAIQTITEEIVIKMAFETKKITGAENLCLAGGVALNSVAIGKLIKQNIFKNIFVQPAAGDAGCALGAALAVYHMYYDCERLVDETSDKMVGTYLGPGFNENDIQLLNNKVKAKCKKYDNFSEISKFIAKQIADGQVIAWFQGRMEFGPRALGNRSILADPRNPNIQKRLNIEIKQREEFRPFACSVIKERAFKYFDIDVDSPYMMLVTYLNKNERKDLPYNFQELTISEKQNTSKSELPGITHVDFSSRIQTVDMNSNSRFWELIYEFEKLTACGLLINTSFNVRGEPIVCSPYDAFRCFMSTNIDYLVIGDFVYCKKEQFNWINKVNWKVEYKPD